MSSEQNGLTPVIPYARPYWDEKESEALAEVVRSGMWTGGDRTRTFEQALERVVGAPHVVCVSNGTAAIHALLHLIRSPRRRNLFITPALNFLAGPAVAVQLGYDVAFTDIEPTTLNMDVESLRSVLAAVAPGYERIVVMPVHFAGLPADINEIVATANAYDAVVVEDACHALPARYATDGAPVGSHTGSLGAVFSFHPTKPVAAGEGGAVAVTDAVLAERLRQYRNHNMRRNDLNPALSLDTDGLPKPWYYQVDTPGHNLRMSEFHAAVGSVQLSRLPESLAHRAAIAQRYRAELAGSPYLRYVPADDNGRSGLHLFPVSLDLDALKVTKQAVFAHYRSYGVVPQVHYTPVSEQPAFAQAIHPREGFPGLDYTSPGLLSLPLFHGMTDEDQDRVLHATRALFGGRVASE